MIGEGRCGVSLFCAANRQALRTAVSAGIERKIPVAADHVFHRSRLDNFNFTDQVFVYDPGSIREADLIADL